MFLFDRFLNIPPVGILYFIYGLSFFFLSISILFKETKESELKLAGSLWLLIGFGFTHGIHEWLEFYLLMQDQYIYAAEIFWFYLIEISALVISFLFLLYFGLSLISPKNENLRKWLMGVPAVLFLLWILYLWNSGFSFNTHFIKKADISARYGLGFVGTLLTAYGLIICSNETKNMSYSVSKKLFYAGTTFGLYGIFEGLFPSHAKLPYFQIPIEVLRSITAVLITYFIIRALDIFDVETRRSLEKNLKRLAQSEKLVSLGQLSAGIAHEINNPLANISLNVQMLRDRLKGIDNPETVRRLDSIEKNIVKASTIAKEILLFSRDMPQDIKAVNLNSIMRGALILMQHEFKDIVVHQNFSDVPDVMGDPVKLEQVFINILHNSIQAMPDGGDIHVDSFYDDGWVKIKIADSGAGVPQKNLSKVFDPFFSTKEIGKGTGLGLSICYGIISQHNGDIDVESTLGEETAVTVRLPAVDKKA